MSYLPDALALDSDVALGYSPPNHYHGSALVVDAPVVAPYLWVQPAPPWEEGENELFEFAYLHTPSADLDGLLTDYDPPANTLFINSITVSWVGGEIIISTTVSGTITINGAVAESEFMIITTTVRDIVAGVNDYDVIAYGTSLPDGSYTASTEDYLDDVIVFAFSPFGIMYENITAYSIGDVIHPTTWNGLIYVCTASGVSDTEEPTWSLVEEEISAIGTAFFKTVKYNRPVAHAPIKPIEV